MSEAHVALYRKYRPQSFDQVVGQEQAVLILRSSIKQNKINHAYLFCGGRGTGKTSVARIVARDIGCNPEDIIEIDAASNRGIDDIRELRDAVRTQPFSSPYKVYIIDEAHMLTKEAANALLKTLEEPPRHVVFILATTDPDKLPETIVSRCQKIVFNQPSIETLAKQLQKIAQQEGHTLSDESSVLIAQHGGASYRDALGLLEQIIQISTGAIKHAAVTTFLGTTEQESLTQLLFALCLRDQQALVESISAIAGKNKSAIHAYDDSIELIRQVLLIRIGVKGAQTANPTLIKIATEYPKVISSALILQLLSKRHLVLVSDTHSWTAYTAIMLGCISE